MMNINHNNIKLTIIKKPEEKDIKFLKTNYNFHPLVLDELARPTFYPKMENYQDHAFLITRFPQFNRAKDEVQPSEIDFILTKDELIIVQFNGFQELEMLTKELEMEQPRRDEFFRVSSAFLLYKIIDHLLRSLYPQLDHIMKKVDNVEYRLFKGQEEKLLPEISLLRREVIDFKRILNPNAKILEEIAENPKEVFGEEISSYFQELFTKNSRLNTLVESQAETLLVIHETNESVLSNKISSIMKVLTMFSVVVFPLTLFAAIWGMNVKYMPLVGQPYDFWILVSLMGVGTIIFLTVFKLKKWI